MNPSHFSRASTVELADDTFDLWIGNTHELISIGALTAAQMLDGFRFYLGAAAKAGILTIDSLTVSSVSAVPEPATAG